MGPLLLQVPWTRSAACCRAWGVGFVCRAMSPGQALALESRMGLFSQYMRHGSGSLITPLAHPPPPSVLSCLVI